MRQLHDLTTALVNPRELAPYYRNPRVGNVGKIAESLRANGQYRPIVVNKGTHTGRPNEVLAGNHTLQAALHVELDTVWVSYVDVPDEHAARIVAADNRTGDLGEYDDRLLLELLASIEDASGDLHGTGYDPGDLAALEKALDDELDETDSAGGADPDYSRKVDAPHYEVKGDRPDVTELVDTTKTDELTAQIDDADLPDDVADFLRAAAQRHTVFRYDRIAEFYAHAPADVQRLMERSALVIVDFDNAIRDGYVKLSSKLADLLDADKEHVELDEGSDQ